MDDMPRSPDHIFGAPRTPSALVMRQRLLDLLDGPEALVVVRGPAGYGKTALLAQWGQNTRVSGVWLSIETGEADSAGFASLLVRSMADAGFVRPGTVLETAELAFESADEPWGILRRGLAQLDRDLVLVIDNGDRLPDDAVKHLIELLAASPRVRARVATRRTSALLSSATALVLDSKVIEASALQMTDDEVAAAVRAAGVTTDPTPFIRAAGGLPLAVRALILQADAVGAESPNVGFTRAIDAIESYLSVHGNENAVDPRYARFLARTSLAEVLTEELAVSLTGEDDVADLFGQAEASGLGMWSDEGPARVFTYTTIVRELLRRALERTAPTERRELQRTIALWSARNHRPLSAVALAVEIGDFALASDVTRGAWSSLLLSHGGKLRPIFAGVSVASLSRYPVITMVLALSYNAASMHRVKAVELFAVSIVSARIQRRRASPPDRALLSGMESASLRVIGQFDQALAAARDAVTSLNALSITDREALGTLVPALYSHSGLSLFYSGQVNEALAAFRSAVSLGDSLSSVSGLSGLSHTAGVLALAGDLTDARAVCENARARVWPDSWDTAYLGSFYQLAEALLALEDGDTHEASRRIGLLDRHRDTIEHWPLLSDAEAMIAILRGTPAEGLAVLEMSVRRHSNRASTAAPIVRRVAVTQSLLELAAGAVAAAEKRLAPLAAKDQQAAVAFARIALVRGDAAAALRRLEASPAAGSQRTTRMKAEAGAVETAALLREGRQVEALRSLEKLCGVLKVSGLRLPLVLLPDHDVRALRALAAERQELLDAFDGIVGVIPEAAGGAVLTQRETIVLQALARHRTVADVAADLFVSPNTVKSQSRALYRKLGVSNREDAIAVGRQQGHILEGSSGH
ncbi:LuxR family maltose regulon positive regulatory protein [Okibacterium sp. HSC-33S16]|uniref:helix-turn-helix transcriptional regulator n=1 Tax=Okibacterium sp. HSC-33S16 TaxID=2910965 RepID=UPI00209F46F5|nr:LuxR C-terminal-related transcriptional regulator [Okibacterium sp. HSC-33S16]MCP2032175.1 LuxR family maltose regulon positive regulatory protein [Okibacterium sp. HSC-33S16]